MAKFVTDLATQALTWGDAPMLDANYNRVIRTLSSFRVLRLNSVESGSVRRDHRCSKHPSDHARHHGALAR